MKTLHISIIIIGIAISVIFGTIMLLTPSNQIVILSGNKALQVCAAVKVPCVTNPTFPATQTGFDNYVVILKINDKKYQVTISGATRLCCANRIKVKPITHLQILLQVFPKVLKL